MQVIVEISSIELDPTMPAYAPDTAAREAAYAEWVAERYIKAISKNTYVDKERSREDLDGWKLAGQPNEHVFGMTIEICQQEPCRPQE